MRSILMALACLLGFQGCALAQTLPAPSMWQNERGSMLEISAADSSGALEGTFTNQAPGYACQGIPYPISGVGKLAAVIFWVTFTKCNSHVTFSGTLDGSKLTTNWTLIFIKEGSPTELKGSDLFTRVR